MTVAFSRRRSSAAGLPTTFERPTTTARRPAIGIPERLRISTAAWAVVGRNPEWPRSRCPALSGWIPSMSLAGSSVSVTVGQRDPLGQRHLDDDPGHERVLVEGHDRVAETGRRGATRDLDEPAGDADALARPQDLLEVDGRRGVPADEHDREGRRVAVAPAERRDVGLHPGLDLRGDRGTARLRASGAAGHAGEAAVTLATVRPASSPPPGHPPHHEAASSKSGARGSPEATTSRARAARRCHVVEDSSTRSVRLGGERVVADGRQVDPDVRGRSPGSRLAEQGRDEDIAGGVDVAPAGQRLRGRDDVPARLEAEHRGLGGGARRGLERDGPGLAFRVGLARQLPGGREPAVRRGVLVGQLEQPFREAAALARRSMRTWLRGRRTSAGRSTGTSTIATSAAATLPATADALPPPGTGSDDARRSMNALERQVAEALREVIRCHAADCRAAARDERGTGAPTPGQPGSGRWEGTRPGPLGGRVRRAHMVPGRPRATRRR